MTFKNLRTRRDFVKLGCRTISTIGAASAFGQAGLLSAATAPVEDYKALVCIFLFGGSDANNMLIPNDAAGYKLYQGVRQSLAIPQASLAPISANFGLHPSLKPLADLYNKVNVGSNPNQVAVLANVGTLVARVPRIGNKPNLNAVPLPRNLFSHSDQQSEWQTSEPGQPSTSGWGGRLVDRTVADRLFPPAIGINGGALQLVGNNTQPTVVGGNFSVLGSDHSAAADLRAAGLAQMLSLQSNATLIQAASGTIKTAIDVAAKIDSLVNGGTTFTVPFPNTDIGQQLAQVAGLIRARPNLGNRQIFFCSQGGYDTHSGQLGQHAQLLSDLANAMNAFGLATTEMQIADKVVTFTESEFSRTFQPNGNAGTDHAWGSHTFIMGGAVKSGVYGVFPTLALQGPDDSGDRGNWVPTTATDQYGAALAKWFGLSRQEDLDYVFPHLKSFNYQVPGFV